MVTTAAQIPVPASMEDTMSLLANLMERLVNQNRGERLTDTRGIGKPNNLQG